VSSRRRCLRAGGALATSLALPVLGGCSRPDGQPHELRFWAMGREAEVAGELVQGFERENPGTRVRVQALPWSAAHEKLLTAYAGDATPDLAQMGNSWLPEMAALNALQPLDPWLAQADAPPRADHFEGIWQTNVVAGQTLGLPWYVDTRLLFLRRDLLQAAGVAQVPEDWPAWVAAMQALQARGVAHPLLLPTNEFEPLLALALQQGQPLLRDGGRHGNFSQPGFQRALAFYLQCFERGFAAGVSNNQVANVWQEFERGTFAFYITGPWNIGEFKRRLPAALQPHWATAPLPGPVVGQGASIAGGASLVVFRRSPRRALALRLLAYLSRPAVQLQFYRLTGNLPPRRSTWALPLQADGTPLAQDPHARAFAQQLERVRATPAVPEWERIVQEMQLAAARAAFHRQDVASTTRALDARVDSMLAKRRWLLDRSVAPAATSTPAA
jgi:multiple sugar transport system substrate-binding protein